MSDVGLGDKRFHIKITRKFVSNVNNDNKLLTFLLDLD